MILSPE